MINPSPSSPPQVSKLPFHYGWIVMICGTICIFAALGLGRFSLGMLLPSMGQALSLSYSQMGFISTANFIGYLAAVLVSSRIMKKIGGRNCVAAALALVGCSMMLIGKAQSLAAITILYILTGMGSGLANVPIMALISIWFAEHRRGKAAGFVVIGSGFAILLCGRLIPYLNSAQNDGWRLNWLVLGATVLVCALICYLFIRNSPEQKGLEPLGKTTSTASRQPQDPSDRPTPLTTRIVLHCAAIYFLFGFSYVIYITFIITALVQDRGYGEAAAGIFWSIIGLLSLISGPIPGTLSDRFGRKAALIGVFTIQACAYLFAALNLPNIFLLVSVCCYGVVAWSVPSIISALVADFSSRERIAAIFGFVTFTFGIGQISGPYIAGLLAEKTGDFSMSFFLAFAVALSAIIMSSMLPSKNNK